MPNSPIQPISATPDLDLGHFLELLPIGVVVTAAEHPGLVLALNDAAGSTLGVLPTALVGQPLALIGADSGVEGLMVRALESNEVTHGELVLGDVTDPSHHINVDVTQADYHGQPALLWWLNDITNIRRTEVEWRRRERQLQAVIDASQDAVFEFHLNSGSAILSDRFWEMLGYTADQALKQADGSVEGLYHHLADEHQISFAGSLRLPLQDEPYEWTGAVKAKDGREVWVFFRGKFVDVRSEPRVLGVVTDITAQKAVEDNLRRAKESAEEANRAKSTFLATMSHEIRTPMTAILGSLEYLTETPLAKEQQRMVGIAKESGGSLLEILNDILDLSKIEAGKLTIESAEMSPRAVIQGACDGAQVVARRKGITLQYSIEDSVPGLVISDPVRVRQVLMNLVNNAVKFTESGGVSVRVRLEGQNQLRMEVKDTGIGLSAEQRERLFKPFSQADDSTTRKFGGTGLGLSICQKLVERMNGEIGVESEAGQGSTFWFYVQVGRTDKQPDDTHEVRLNGVKVLLIDSDTLSSKETMELLTTAGAEVTLARESQKAFQLLTQKIFEVVVLEQKLEGSAPGLALAPAIRVIQPHASQILYTEEEGGTIAAAAEQGQILYLPRTTPYVQVLKAVKAAAAGAKPLRAGVMKKGRVLIAEDTASVRQIIEVQLRGLDIEVDFVENGKLALDKLQRGRYSLLISDLHMPEIDGYGLFKEWREREARRGKPERLPIVALTADVLIGDQSKFLAAGFDDYLAKPVSRNVLHQIVRKWLSGEAEPEEAPLPEPQNSNEADNPIDHNRLIEILGMDDKDIISESMAIFVDTAKETFAALEAAFAADDVQAAKGPAHSLKGSARMAGAVNLGELCAELDAAAKKDCLLTDKLAEAREELARVLKYVNSYYLKGQN
jgi:two-component system, sensor histidine kinase and response regulator